MELTLLRIVKDIEKCKSTKNLEKKGDAGMKSRDIGDKFWAIVKSNIKKVSLGKKFNFKIVNSKRFIISLIVLILLCIIVPYAIFANNAYSVIINNVEVAKVKNKKMAETAMGSLKQQFEKDNEVIVAWSSQPTYKKVKASKKELYEGKALEEQLKKYMDYKIKAFILYVNDNPLVCLKTKDEAHGVLSDVEDNFLKDMDKSIFKEIGFAEKVEIREEYCEVSNLMSREEAKSFIINGTGQIKVHKVESGESFWSICRKLGITMEELTKANPGVNPEKIKIGQEINLEVSKPLLSIKTVEETIYRDKIPFEQKVEFSNSMYKNQTSIRVKGEYGEKEVQAKIIRINSIETQREIIKEKIIKKPKDQIIVKGTKES